MTVAKQSGWEMQDTDSALWIVKDLKGIEEQFTFYWRVEKGINGMAGVIAQEDTEKLHFEMTRSRKKLYGEPQRGMLQQLL